jgi:hypothetical protein
MHLHFFLQFINYEWLRGCVCLFARTEQMYASDSTFGRDEVKLKQFLLMKLLRNIRSKKWSVIVIVLFH